MIWKYPSVAKFVVLVTILLSSHLSECVSCAVVSSNKKPACGGGAPHNAGRLNYWPQSRATRVHRGGRNIRTSVYQRRRRRLMAKRTTGPLDIPLDSSPLGVPIVRLWLVYPLSPMLGGGRQAQRRIASARESMLWLSPGKWRACSFLQGVQCLVYSPFPFTSIPRRASRNMVPLCSRWLCWALAEGTRVIGAGSPHERQKAIR